MNEGFTEEDMLEDLKKFLELFNQLASKVTKTSYDSLVNSIDEIQEDTAKLKKLEQHKKIRHSKGSGST